MRWKGVYCTFRRRWKVKKKQKTKKPAEAITAWAMRKLERWESEKTGKAAWWVFLIDVWPQPSCLPAPPAPAGICRLTPLPSPRTANTRGGTHFFFLPSNYTFPGRYWLPSCIISGEGSASSLPSAGLKHPALPFQVIFPQELLGSFGGNSSARPPAA